MNLETAIKTAIEYETRIRDLYLDASGDIPDPVGQALFKALGEDEQYHLSYLQDRLRQWERSGEVTFEALKTTVPSREAVTRGVKALRRRMAEDDRGDEKQMLSKALEVEVETSDFYRRLVGELSGEAQRMFARFLEIEDSHIAIVQAQLDYLIQSGYWFDFKEFDMEDF